MSDIENMSKKCVINKKTAVERPAVKYLKYELAQRPIIDKLQLHYHEYGSGVCNQSHCIELVQGGVSRHLAYFWTKTKLKKNTQHTAEPY